MTGEALESDVGTAAEKKRDNDLEGKQVEYLNSCRRLLQFCMAEIKFLMNLSMSRNPGKEEYHAGCEG